MHCRSTAVRAASGRDLDVLFEDDDALVGVGVGEERAERPAVVQRQVGVAGELGEVRARLELDCLARVHDSARAVPGDDRRDIGVLAVLRDEHWEAISSRVVQVDRLERSVEVAAAGGRGSHAVGAGAGACRSKRAEQGRAAKPVRAKRGSNARRAGVRVLLLAVAPWPIVGDDDDGNAAGSQQGEASGGLHWCRRGNLLGRPRRARRRRVG